MPPAFVIVGKTVAESQAFRYAQIAWIKAISPELTQKQRFPLCHNGADADFMHSISNGCQVF
jgi:hypothetical protein